jgi:hypothetical protein
MSSEVAWQLRTLKILQKLIEGEPDLPVMVWTITPHGATGEPYSAGTNAERLHAFDSWTDRLDAVRWEPRTGDGMTNLTASVKSYHSSNASVMIRTTLYEEESVDQ